MWFLFAFMPKTIHSKRHRQNEQQTTTTTTKISQTTANISSIFNARIMSDCIRHAILVTFSLARSAKFIYNINSSVINLMLWRNTHLVAAEQMEIVPAHTCIGWKTSSNFCCCCCRSFVVGWKIKHFRLANTIGNSNVARVKEM